MKQIFLIAFFLLCCSMKAKKQYYNIRIEGTCEIITFTNVPVEFYVHLIKNATAWTAPTSTTEKRVRDTITLTVKIKNKTP